MRQVAAGLALLCLGVSGAHSAGSPVTRSGETVLPPAELAASAWQVENIDERGIIDRSMVTLALDDDGRIAGSAGCNRYFGTLYVDGDVFTVSGIGSTRRACVAALMNQEQRFLRALEDAARYALDAVGRLEIYDGAGARRLVAVALENDPAADAAGSSRPMDGASGTLHVFTCGSGEQVTVRFLDAETIDETIDETIELSTADATYVLQRSRSASGARYTGAGVEFFNKGDEAMLILGSGRYTCTREPV